MVKCDIGVSRTFTFGFIDILVILIDVFRISRELDVYKVGRGGKIRVK